MKRVCVVAVVLFALLLASGIGRTDTLWSQSPDMAGGIAYSSEVKVPSTVADNWACPDEDVIISAIRWWGAYWTPYEDGAYASDSDSLANAAPGAYGFMITLWENVPGDPGGVPFDHPGAGVWSLFSTTFTEESHGTTANGRSVYEYSIDIPVDKRFVRNQGSGAATYWLSVEAELRDGIGRYDTTRQWGWLEAANSDQNAPGAVQDFKYSRWKTITNNLYSSDMSFEIETHTVPEPGAMAMLGFAAAGAAAFAASMRRMTPNGRV